MTFRQFLQLKFLEWQQQSGGRKKVWEFAEWIGVSQSTISMWWNGKRLPEGENITKLVDKFGMEVYDVLGLPRPNENLYYVTKHFEKVPDKLQKAIREQIEKYLTGE